MDSARSLISFKSTSIRRNDHYTDVESNHTIGGTPQIYGQKGIPMKTRVVGGVSEDMELHPLPQAGQIQVEHGIVSTHSEA